MLVVLGFGWPAPAGATTVHVTTGETLTQIARTYGTSISGLAAANGIADPNKVEAGMVLQIPTTGGTRSSGAAQVDSTTIEVSPGDSLWSIASRFGSTTTALAAANGIANPAHVLIGTVLSVPVPHTAAPAPVTTTLGAAALLDQPVGETLAPLFQHWASHFGLSLSLLEGMCWWESGWQMGVTSSTGAVGVGQLEPVTVSLLRVELGDQSLDPENASDNIEMAAYYLHQLLTQNGENEDLALAGYYQGPTSVREVGMMPSTVQYVEGVLATARLFR